MTAEDMLTKLNSALALIEKVKSSDAGHNVFADARKAGYLVESVIKALQRQAEEEGSAADRLAQRLPSNRT